VLYVKLKIKNFDENVYFDCDQIFTVDRYHRALSIYVSFIRHPSLKSKILKVKSNNISPSLVAASSRDSDSRSMCTQIYDQFFITSMY